MKNESVVSTTVEKRQEEYTIINDGEQHQLVYDYNVEENHIVGTFLNKTNINGLCQMFKTEEDYVHHMETLWALREVAINQCGGDCNPDITHPMFRVAKLANDLIGVLLQNNIGFSMNNGIISHRVEKERKRK